MIEQIRAAYMHRQWVKALTFCLLIVLGGILFGVSGGFPPWAWRFLFQILPQISLLWGERGPAVLPPLAGLVLLSLSLLILWTVLTILAIRVGMHWWRIASSTTTEPVEEEELEEDSRSWSNISTAPMRQPVPQQRMAAGAEPRHVPSAVARSTRPMGGPVWQPQSRSATWEAPSRPIATAVRQPLHLVQTTRMKPPQNDGGGYDTLPEFFVDDDMTDSEEDSDDSLEMLGNNSAEQYEDEQEQQLDEEAEEEEEKRRFEDEETVEIAAQPAPESTLRFLVGVGLDPGITRRDAPNEDTLLSVQCTRFTTGSPEPIGLFMVADGMGGHANGQEASRLAIQTIGDAIVPVLTRDAEQIDSFAALLKDGIHRANLALYRRNRQEPDMMGTTLTAALVTADAAYVANVGDSRTYLYRPSTGLRQLTRDHSLVARMVENGVITRDEVYTHPKRNQIYRCLGDHSTVDVDSFMEKLRAGDVLLLCSDGLWEMVRDGDIERIIQAGLPHPTQISSALVQAALSRGGADNISVVIVYISPV
ncbi:MAG: serine/threonine-protein phosphatase [Ktedonobacteraceae bacterium]|nr:serine/threonine-protein phosphatase [Ktedonobacteraceae bacterium]